MFSAAQLMGFASWPMLGGLGLLWFTASVSSGRHPFKMIELHRKYGDVVRIGPNSLSFNTPEAYMDVYGRPSQRKKAFLKFAKYERPGDISTTRDPELHAVQKKALSKGFSATALRDQETVLQQYLQLLIQQLHDLGSNGKAAVNVGEALNWFTLDITGDLAFGESFDSLAKASNHSQALITDALRYSGVEYLKRQRPYLGPLIARLLFPRSLEEKHRQYQKIADEKAEKRIQRHDLNRQDFFSHLIKDRRITKRELMATAWTLIMAGSETTATALTAIIFYLLRNPDPMEKLVQEVRTSFKSPAEITGDSVTGLTYLNSVIEEGLRLFPPLAIGLPRESPGAVVDSRYIPKGVCVSVENFSLSYDARYWKDPESFKPERWLGNGFESDCKLAHHPFSEGTRSCIGKNLAYLEMRILLTSLVYHFDWELISDIEDWNRTCMCYALWTMPDLQVKFHPRFKS
ncbi:cytochrome p40 monooxygenase [Colletotrichum incanum]|uniref:Cytochrome p40 monooxygenase n=1 Tax=Colletotrichum incanum TaxID=1573173 RepID=A0A162NLK1_COLIC|nr:cytochrome p40 monooxygenase [Colletotrichum incanum]